MMRTFIAIEIPEALKKRIVAVQDQMKQFNSPVRWVSKESLHITLKFLGTVPDNTIAQIGQRLEPVARKVAPFQISLGKLGVFPEGGDPRIIWMGISSKDNLLHKINSQIESAMYGINCKQEDRPFKPHLTLGRVRGKDNLFRLMAFVKLYGTDQVGGEFRADEIILYLSRLMSSGAVYKKLHSFPFSG